MEREKRKPFKHIFDDGLRTFATQTPLGIGCISLMNKHNFSLFAPRNDFKSQLNLRFTYYPPKRGQKLKNRLLPMDSTDNQFVAIPVST